MTASYVLFVCVHNAGRSQMARALFDHAAAQRGLAVRARSAGTEPAERVHSVVEEAMRELGEDLSGAAPQLMTNAMVEQAVRVITMGCAVDADACPAIALRDVDDWGLPDPKGQPLAEVRRIRDDIAARVNALLDDLAPQRKSRA